MTDFFTQDIAIPKISHIFALLIKRRQQKPEILRACCNW